MTRIEAGRIVLRPVEETDHPLILVWQNDPEVAWWMDYERTFTLEDIHESEERAKLEGHAFLIEAAGRPVGRIGLNAYRERDGVCSLYVFIGERTAWGHGYGPEAIVAMLGWGFANLDLYLVELWGLSANERAFHAYERVGMRRDGTLRERSYKSDGRHHDRTVMSITRDEFERLHPNALQGNG
jgi:[ribosomal protein S5]-alanine N-acetyltransferase